jgi:hypothetical protein
VLAQKLDSASRRRRCRWSTIRCCRAAPGKAPLFGNYRVDDEGVPAQRVSLIEKGVLKSLLMSRTAAQGAARFETGGGGPRTRAAVPGVRAHVGDAGADRESGQPVSAPI